MSFIKTRKESELIAEEEILKEENLIDEENEFLVIDEEDKSIEKDEESEILLKDESTLDLKDELEDVFLGEKEGYAPETKSDKNELSSKYIKNAIEREIELSASKEAEASQATVNKEPESSTLDSTRIAAYTLASLVTLPFAIPMLALNKMFKKNPINMDAVIKGNSPFTKMNKDLDEVSSMSELFSDSNVRSLADEISRDTKFTSDQKEQAMSEFWERIKKGDIGDGRLKNMARKLDSGSLSILKRDPKKLEKDLLSFISKNNSKKALLDMAEKLENTINKIPKGFSPFKKIINVLNNVLNIVKGILKTKFNIDLDSGKEEQASSNIKTPEFG